MVCEACGRDGVEKKAQEEESRRIALEALEKRYCMNCFQPREKCECSAGELTGMLGGSRMEAVGVWAWGEA